MARYSISDLEQLSGVKAHTIRIWEQRYNLLHPNRTATNIRTYGEADLRRLLNVATLCGRGQRISQVVRLSEEECQAAALALCNEVQPADCARINALQAAALDLDEPRLHHLLDEAISELGPEDAILRLGYPVLQRLSVSWKEGSLGVAQERLVAQLLRQELLASADALPLLPLATSDAPRWLLFLPEGEWHELALLFMNYALRARGQQVLYLGPNLALADVVAAAQAFRPTVLATVLTTVPARSHVAAYATALHQQCPEATVLLFGGLAVQATGLPEGCLQTACLHEFRDLIPFVNQEVGRELVEN
ncbi:MerR family transcriptional regulator [Hymenobacter sp. HMF4947]|uniref:MerR family transcriptional regulator n=1 Tax=Hymenobacter ginkgonis TaxID=2682976 RepID=A0A7K1TIR7_9BACT|nr:MerR family transcriptional regulator [Hymenobacter ginkgonis]MVN78071.1 MerR family transcriptional regulator [Hymenobacter ginkgonis]